MRPILIGFLCALLSGLVPVRTAFAGPNAIEVFTGGRFAVAGIEAARAAGFPVRVYDLDAPKKWEAEMNAGLPQGAEAAKAAVMAKIQASGGIEAVKKRLEAAYAGHFKAFQYEITKYPAIVFDGGRSAVYGVTDLNEALDRYDDWSREQGPNE